MTQEILRREPREIAAPLHRWAGFRAGSPRDQGEIRADSGRLGAAGQPLHAPEFVLVEQWVSHGRERIRCESVTTCSARRWPKALTV